MSSAHATFTTTLAERLGETEPEPIAQLGRIVERCGIEQSTRWLDETERIEAQGGQMLTNNQRRRTKGGVFFHLVRQVVTGEDRHYIFPYMAKGNKPSAPAPAVLVTTWADRDRLIQEAQQMNGKATTVKITVIGKIGKAVERQGFTLVTLQHNGKLPALPKGIPTPSQPLPTNYILYIGSKQWSKIKASLSNSEDALIAEGTPVVDPKYQAITVFVTNATSKVLQQAQRQQQKLVQENNHTDD